MSYNSLTFIISLPFIVLGYYTMPARWRNAALLAASLALYMLWWPAGILVMTWVILTSHLGIGYITRQREHSLGAMWLTIALTALPMLFFKYLQPLNETITSFLHIEWWLNRHHWYVPVGLSFYTLQAIALVVDVYKQRIKPASSLVNHAAFMSFFPITASGPIVRGDELLVQLEKRERRFDPELAWQGLRWLIWGMFMKVAVAESFALFVHAVEMRIDTQNGFTLLLSTLCYTIQLYADFAGYSLMALGVSALLGIKLRHNFWHPLFAVGIKDFWRRWHISLSQWLRDYIYIPLGGNRCSAWRSRLNVMATFVFSGLWHGAGIAYLLWGAMHGLWLVIERLLRFDRWPQHWLLRLPLCLTTFVLVAVLFMLFSHDVPTTLHIIDRFFGQWDGFRLTVTQSVSNLSREWSMVVLFSVMIAKEARDEWAPTLLSQRTWQIAFYSGVVLLTLMFGVFDRSGQFIYMHF